MGNRKMLVGEYVLSVHSYIEFAPHETILRGVADPEIWGLFAPLMKAGCPQYANKSANKKIIPMSGAAPKEKQCLRANPPRLCFPLLKANISGAKGYTAVSVAWGPNFLIHTNHASPPGYAPDRHGRRRPHQSPVSPANIFRSAMRVHARFSSRFSGRMIPCLVKEFAV